MEPLAGGRRGGRGGGTKAAVAAPEPPRSEPLPLWLWPLLGALVLALLRAARLELDPVPVSAVHALLAAALLFRALLALPRTADRPAVLGPWRREPITLCLGCFLAFSLLSLAISIYAHGTLTALLDLAALFSAYLLLAHGGGGRRVVYWALGALLIAGLIAAAQALQEWIQALQRTPQFPHGNPGWRAFGPFFNPNLLAAAAILLAPIALAVMLRVERVAEVIGAGAAVLLLVAALLVSGSRGGALGLIAGAIAFTGVAAIRGLRPGPKPRRALLGLAVLLLPLLWALRVPMLGRLAHVAGTPAVAPGSSAATASERSNTFRKLTWQATLQIIRDHPLLGTGAGTFRFALPRYAEAGYTGMAHESYLQIAAEAGIPALLAWMAALALVIRRLASRRGHADWLIPGIAGGIAAAMVHNLVDYSWSVPGTALPFWALLGSAVALTADQAKIQHAIQPQRPTPNAQRLLLGLSGVLLLALNGAWLLAAEHQEQAQAAIAERDPQGANDEYQAAAALAPQDAELQLHWASLEAALGNRPGAEQALRRAAALASPWSRPHYRLGQLLEGAGQLPEAAAQFEAAAQRDPRSTPPLVELAKLREAQGDHLAALSIYRRIIAMEDTLGGIDQMTDPNPAVAHDALGREAEAHGDLQTAISEYRSAAERLREYRQQRTYRTAIREAIGDAPSGRDADLQRLEVRLWQRLAALYTQRGQPEAAAEAQREATAAQAAAAQASVPLGSP